MEESSGSRPFSKRRRLAQDDEEAINATLALLSTQAPNAASTSSSIDSSRKPAQKSLLQTFRDGAVLSAEEINSRNQELIRSSILGQAKGLSSRSQVAGKNDEDIDRTIHTGWTPPTALLEQPAEYHNAVRKFHGIAVIGQDIPPAITSFEMMRLPREIISVLHSMQAMSPRPIQMQGIPAALAGRDVIGTAKTGGGKTLVFVVPMVTLALREELADPFLKGQGPFGIVIAPQRELAQQIYEVTQAFCEEINQQRHVPISTLLAIGGSDIAWRSIPQGRGLHCLICTPGRLEGMLKQSKVNLLRCRLLCLDEADRLVEDSFQSALQTLLDGFQNRPHQTILFSATMPKLVQQLVSKNLHNHIMLSVGQAGTANKDIKQKIYEVPESDKCVKLLHVLRKTAPPTLIFANNQPQVDTIFEYLRIKGVLAGCVHSGIPQDVRTQTVQDFKNERLDVLVSTDLLSKGIDFGLQPIEHVINFDMPTEIENYVHRIGRTGRAGRKGLASTFIDSSKCTESILLDLKQLLKHADQVIPDFLAKLYDPTEALFANNNGNQEQHELIVCEKCGGFGHDLQTCPELLKLQRRGGRRYDTIQSNE